MIQLKSCTGSIMIARTPKKGNMRKILVDVAKGGGGVPKSKW